jgi:hypothetical protein
MISAQTLAFVARKTGTHFSGSCSRITATNKTCPQRQGCGKAKLAEQGLTVAGDSSEHFRGFIDSEIKKWAKVIKDAGLETAK